MRTDRFVASLVTLSAVTLAALPAGAQEPGYASQVSPGQVSLTLEPEWQDTALVVVVRAEAQSGDLKNIDLRSQIMLMADRQTYQPSSAGRLTGRRAIAWVAFRLPKKPEIFALSIRDVPDVSTRILRWPAPVLTP
ncbi:MAG TPA: hypothetical protein VF970_00925 [Gemmatimonadales bacterium]